MPYSAVPEEEKPRQYLYIQSATAQTRKSAQHHPYHRTIEPSS